MNICMCGAQAGYPHDEFCPYALYRGGESEIEKWQAAYDENKADAAEQRQTARDHQEALAVNGADGDGDE